jgi:tetratricopeptide (TPR) repeat protein
VSNMPTTPDHASCPYKGLQPYTEADRKYFFGRTRDEGIIISNLYAASVTVFYGASGVGKSSVLLAGAVPRLKHEPRDAVVVVFNGWQGDEFLGALKNEVARQASLSAPVETALPLDEFLAETQRALGLPLFLIFDQFEEYFLYHPPSPSAEVFESSFARAVNRRDVQVNFFLSLREDGLSKLDRLKGRVPSLLNNMLRLRHLDRDAAKEAITKPLDEYNRQLPNGQGAVTIEPELVESVLDDLRSVKVISAQAGRGTVQDSSSAPAAEIETPLLQMVLTRLWDEEHAAGSSVLRLQTFEKLGRATNIARTHLDVMMSRLTAVELDAAAAVLRYLVTPTGSKIAQEPAALASWSELSEAEVETILSRLNAPDMRILRTLQAPGEPVRYEIFHDVLARAILDWRGRYVAQRQQDRIRQEEQNRRNQEQEEAERRREKERSRLMRKAIIGLSAVLVLVLGLMVIAFVQTYRARKAIERERTANAKLKAETDAKDHVRKGVDLAKQKRWVEAIQEYENAINLDPDNLTAYSNQGYAYIRLGQEKTGAESARLFKEAIEPLKESIKRDDSFVWGHYNLALAYNNTGDSDAAAKEADKVLEIDKETFCKTFKTDPSYKWVLETQQYKNRCPAPPRSSPSPSLSSPST